MEETETFSFDEDLSLGNLPEEVMLLAFSYLDVRSLACVERVCKNWNRIANDQYLGIELSFAGTRPTCKFSKIKKKLRII